MEMPDRYEIMVDWLGVLGNTALDITGGRVD